MLIEWLRWLGYVLLAASAIPLAMVIRLLVRSRQAPFYAVRQGAIQRLKPWLLALALLLVLGTGLFVLPPYLIEMLSGAREEEQPLDVPPSTPAMAVTFVSLPTSAPTATPTRRPTATPPFIPTPTPVLSPPASALTPLPSAASPSQDAHITIVTLAADRDEEGQPVDAGDEFAPGNRQVYLFISYADMADGVPWTFAIYREGELLDSTTRLWEWGPDGRTSLYYTPPGGYRPGVYEMRVFIGERLQGVAQFVIADD
ncbi:MAG TPA: hypothetical protein ENN99_08255 [Chloroflexi bacterium]|nr:hypothetical protein [Chloroflexota bacterium]